jgi:CubicO group peptidase (beta-lactamase class C family)
MNDIRPICLFALITLSWAAAAAADEPREGRAKSLPFGGESAAPTEAARIASAFRWQTATPESQGMSSARFAALWDDLVKRQTTALVIVRNDRIVFERYAPGWDATKPHGTASLAKALAGGLSLSVALTDSRIALDDSAAKFIPQWKDDPRKRRILIRHLGSHTSGLDDAESDDLPHESLAGWKGDFWKRLDPPHDPFTIARDQTPILCDPGAELQYSNPGIAMLTYAVTASLKDTPHTDVRSLLRERIMRPIGVGDAEWSVGYGKTIMVDDLPLVASWGGGSFTPRAVATVGRLLLREGDWDGHRLLSQAAVRQIIGDAGLPGNCGMGFFTNSHGRYRYLPRDAYWGAGAGDQVLLVVPSLRLIVIRNGQTLEPPPAIAGEKKPDIFVRFHDPRAKILFEPLIAAITNATARSAAPPAAPYPPSRVITSIAWGPVSSIVRRAEDSDNWPITWGDDGLLYTAYGDGTGFEPKVPEKLSLGFAQIDGGPADFKGTNIRSATGERKGDGPHGLKASGLLMVDDVLYMLVRNAGNSQLAWSTDHAKTWTWSDWKFTTSFGCPTFLNFSKNYEGARDEYVYIYSPDAESAYVPADRIVLARVRRDRLKDRTAYEFFTGLNSDGKPTWTADIGRRAGVFENRGHCFRGTVSYNRGLRRYLLCQAGATRDVHAGFGIFGAPEPWGPWTTITYAPQWDTDPGETCNLPTKWISGDGRTLFLVFSGGDAFNVRQARVTISSDR